MKKQYFVLLLLVIVSNSLFSFSKNNLITQPLAVTVSNIIHVTCSGACNGSADVAFTGAGTGPYTIQWIGGTNPAFTNVAASPYTCTGLCGGNYTVRVTGTLMTQIANIVISEPSPIAMFVDTQTDVTCNGLNNGAVSVIVIGGTSPYTLQWNDALNQTGTTINNLSAGTYTCAITDANGCLGSDVVTINEPQPLLLNVTKTDITCNFAPPYPPINDGTALANVSGGTTPYQYIWYPQGFTINNPFVLQAGSHTVVVTDDNGCKDSTTVFINEPPEFTITLSSDSAHCHLSDGATNVVVSGGAAPHSIAWSNGVSTPNNPGLPAGQYDIMVTDALGCIVDGVTVVEDIEGPQVTIIDSSMITCFGANNGTANAIVTGGTLPYQSISWLETGQLGLYGDNLSPGFATIIIYDAAGCVAGDQVYLIEPPQLTISSLDTIHASNFINCDGAATAYPAGGTPLYSYTWIDPSVGVIGTGQSINNLCVGTYTLNITDNNGCVMTSVFPIHVETVGLKEMQTLNASIFPNPTNDGSFKIQLNDASYKNLHFTMYNAAGVMVMDKNLLSQPVNEITTTGLTSGIYFYQLINADGKKYSGKIVIGN